MEGRNGEIKFEKVPKKSVYPERRRPEPQEAKNT
jgi:hypothetical protein